MKIIWKNSEEFCERGTEKVLIILQQCVCLSFCVFTGASSIGKIYFMGIHWNNNERTFVHNNKTTDDESQLTKSITSVQCFLLST